MEEEDEAISFLKEQAWKIDFQTAPVVSGKIYDVINTSGVWMPSPGSTKSLAAKSNGVVDFKVNNHVKPALVNVGNPHIIFFVKNLKKINLRKVGPKIEKNSLFPERINVNFAKILNNNKIKLRVWERGSGITKACGTGASATAVAAIKNKLINKRICHIHMEGGKLKIEYKKNGHIVMTGPIKIIKKGVLNNFF